MTQKELRKVDQGLERGAKMGIGLALGVRPGVGKRGSTRKEGSGESAPLSRDSLHLLPLQSLHEPTQSQGTFPKASSSFPSWPSSNSVFPSTQRSIGSGIRGLRGIQSGALLPGVSVRPPSPHSTAATPPDTLQKPHPPQKLHPTPLTCALLQRGFFPAWLESPPGRPHPEAEASLELRSGSEGD